MEPTTNITKRKKRRTRKCLDELRKRSRRYTVYNSIKSKSPLRNKVTNARSEVLVKSNNNYITSKRLTIAMFSKAIRSETITRPMCSDVMQEPKICIKRPRGSTFCTVTANCFEAKEDSNGDSDYIRHSEDNSKEVFESCLGHDTQKNCSDIENQGDTSAESYLLFSPEEEVRGIDLFDETQNEAVSLVTTPSLASSEESYNYHLYDEFMKEMPLYLKENVPALIKEDVTKKAKIYLHNIYMESCRQECENNILQCIKSNMLSGNNKSNISRETIVQNPMDYLRLGYAWRQNKGQVHDPAGASPDSPGLSTTPLSPPVDSAIHDTPDYDYYPHKLN